MSGRQARRADAQAGRKLGSALRGAYRNAEGVTNRDALEVIVDLLGIDGVEPVRGALYRVGMLQHPDQRTQFIGEYLGLVIDRASGVDEPALAFAIRNPVLAADAPNGTRGNPLILWPLDIWHLQPAQPGDLDRPMHYQVEGEPTFMPAPGRPPKQ